LKVDPTTLEVCPGVFGAGDVTGIGGFTHLAYYHGQSSRDGCEESTRGPITRRSLA
jgi:pyruvate/2-oxoglutarate dehydrogenase complex dihydrolipoamide dehydrogenase (E3) component